MAPGKGADSRRSPGCRGLESGHNGHIRRAAHGYEATREAAMAAFAKSWPTGPSWRNHRSLADFATI